MGFFGRLFGTDKAVDNILDKDKGLLMRFGGFVNDLHYSDAEKAEANKDTREWAIRQLDALAPFKVTQRVLAFATTGVWVFIILNVVAAHWLGEKEIRDGLFELATHQYVAWPILSVFSLYFSGGVIDSWRRKPTETSK